LTCRKSCDKNISVIGGEEKKRENLQTMLTTSDRQRIEWLAKQESRSISDMLRILILESLHRWEASHPGRQRRTKSMETK